MAMGYLLKTASLLIFIGFQVAAEKVSPFGVMGLVFLVALWVYRERYRNLLIFLVPEEAIIIALSLLQPAALILNGPLAFDLAAQGRPWLILALAPAGLYFLAGQYLVFYAMLLGFSLLAGHLRQILNRQELSFTEVYDRERRQRYSLEEAKVRLTNSAREAARFAEIRERNRIAREIHDSLGHSLAGILLRLQVAVKTLDQDPAKARSLLQASVEGLAESVNLLRDTVYNIRPQEKLGLDHFQRLIRDYTFCPVDFQSAGDLSSLSAIHVQILSAVLKEALTNATRHSQATGIEVQLEARKNIVRMLIRDNGVGCQKIREGMGLTGMRERVRNAGGTIAISGEGGFLIVCVLPREETTGEVS